MCVGYISNKGERTVGAKKDFNKVNRLGTNGLIEAIEKNKTAEALDMIHGSADIHFRTSAPSRFADVIFHVPYGVGSTPLHVAAQQGRPEIALALIEQGSEVNTKNEEGLSPMDYAILSYAYYTHEAEKRAGSFLTRSKAMKAVGEISKFEETIQSLLRAGGQPFLYELPEKFKNPPVPKKSVKPAAGGM
jgi:hypothetical protein